MGRAYNKRAAQYRQDGAFKETFNSLGDFLKVCQESGYVDSVSAYDDMSDWVYGPESAYGDQERDANKLAAEGWREGMRQAMPIAEHALQTLDVECEKDTFEASWDMSGSEVDVGRYLTGVPECMIEYQPVKVSNVGKVVTLVSSCSVSAAVSAENVIKRGAAIVGLAMALEESQHSVEIWLDHTGDSNMFSTRVLVKGAQDAIDPAVLAYWLSNPSALRHHMFAHKWLRTGECGLIPGDPIHEPTDPEGTIYIGSICSPVDVNDPDRFVVDTLRQIGLVE